MASRRPQPEIPTVELDDSMWVNVGEHDLHECCFCGAEHRVDLRWKNGRLQERWTITKQPRRTRRSRKG